MGFGRELDANEEYVVVIVGGGEGGVLLAVVVDDGGVCCMAITAAAGDIVRVGSKKQWPAFVSLSLGWSMSIRIRRLQCHSSSFQPNTSCTCARTRTPSGPNSRLPHQIAHLEQVAP